MSECERRNCGYLWKDEDEAYPRCHWEPCCPGDVAPCDEDGNDPYEDWDEGWEADEEYGCSESAEDLEMGFDPYVGGYTWDC